jgi:hypothetical protein
LYRRLGGQESRSGPMEKILDPTMTRTRTLRSYSPQPVSVPTELSLFPQNFCNVSYLPTYRDYVAFDDRWIMNLKGFGRRRWPPNRGTNPGICLEGLKKTTKPLSHYSRYPDGDSNLAPPKYNSKTFLYTCLFGIFVWIRLYGITVIFILFYSLLLTQGRTMISLSKHWGPPLLLGPLEEPWMWYRARTVSMEALLTAVGCDNAELTVCMPS